VASASTLVSRIAAAMTARQRSCSARACSSCAGVPKDSFTPLALYASSSRLALPTIRAPAARAPARHGAPRSAAAAVAASARLPAVVGTPATSIRSLTASRAPLPDPGTRVMKVAISSMSGLRASQPDQWDLSAGPFVVARVPGSFDVYPFPHCLALVAGKDFRVS
jgi:hypothetical protein